MLRYLLIGAGLYAVISTAQARPFYEYDFIPTSGAGFSGANVPFTDPRMVLTVSDAVRKSGGIDLNWQKCNPSYGCSQPMIGSIDGIALTVFNFPWSPQIGTTIVDLDFKGNSISGSMLVLGTAIDMRWSSSASSNIGLGSLNADFLNCYGGGGYGCSFTGWWRDPPAAAAPEPSSLGMLAIGMVLVGGLLWGRKIVNGSPFELPHRIKP